MLRAAVAEGTELGQQAEAIMNAGGLVGDDIMIGIVAERLGEGRRQQLGVLLDGFPRTAEQADALEAISARQALTHCAINLDVPRRGTVDRIACWLRGREDDTSKKPSSRRLGLYVTQETAPLLDWFDERGPVGTRSTACGQRRRRLRAPRAKSSRPIVA